MTAPFDKLREALDQRGCTLEPIYSYPLEGDRTIEAWLIFRKTKPPLRILVTNSAEYGYSLYIEHPAGTIDEDVAAILSAPPEP